MTDGFTTVNKVIAIDRRPTIVSALVTQILDLVSITGSIDSFVDFEIIVQTVVSGAGFNDSFSFIPMSQVISIAGANDEFTLGASVMADNITADGIAFNYQFLDPNYQVVASRNLAMFIKVYRLFEDSPQTNEASIGCTPASAAGFRANLLSAVQSKFSDPLITYSSCSTGTFVLDGPLMISYIYETNNGVGAGGS